MNPSVHQEVFPSIFTFLQIFRSRVCLSILGGLVVAVLSPAVCVTTHAAEVAVFYALDADLRTLKTDATVFGQPVSVCGHTVQRLALEGHRIYAVKMGSGVTETAVAGAALLTKFHCDLALSIGPIGTLDDDATVGSWKTVGAVIPYQKGNWDKGGFHMKAEPITATTMSQQSGAEWVKPPAPLAGSGAVTIASGEVFLESAAQREQLRAATSAQAVDMNLFGLLTACGSQKVPLFSWRIISDRADNEAGSAFKNFTDHYDGAGGHYIAEMIRHLALNQNSIEAYPALKQLSEQTQSTLSK